MHLSVPAVRTKRLVIRSFKKRDFKSWRQSHVQRPKTSDPFETRRLTAKQATRKRFEKWLKVKNRMRKKDIHYVFGVFDQKTGDHLGTLDFLIFTRLSNQSANLGYGFHTQYWGHGYAEEALRAFLPHVLRKLKLHRLEAGVQPKNHRSISLVKRLGFRSEGRRTGYLYDGKKWIDLLCYVTSVEDWGIRPSPPSVKTDFSEYY